MDSTFHLIAAPHTPFRLDGELAPNGVPEQASFLKSAGVTGVFGAGSTGEWPALQIEERIQLAEAWSEAALQYGLELFIHVGHLCHQDALGLAEHAGGLEGVTATAALAPSFFKPDGIDGLIDWCAPLARAGGKPFYYYHIPVLTHVEVDVAGLLREGEERIPHFEGVKFTASDPVGCAASVANPRFRTLFGIDEEMLDGVRAGSKGAVGSSYNFAAPLYFALVQAEQAGQSERAEELQKKASDMIDCIAANGYLPTARAIMEDLGVPVGDPRLPLQPYAGDIVSLKEQLQQLGLEKTPRGWGPTS
ncbi:MAG: dihydrodipicolinate synthase family protein [Planctomycetes bacterium]|nr:dihydrodipicolinate synthase family protein [Planctomycetota bacterium]